MRNSLLILGFMLALANLWASPARADEPYPFDITYSGTYVTETGPSGSATVYGTAQGRRSVLLADGSSATVGLVRYAGQSAPYFNVMLSRRGPSGAALNWPGASTSTRIYPSAASGDAARILTVDDVAISDDRLFVLTTRRFFEPTQDDDVEVLVFDLDGNNLATVSALSSTWSEHGKAMSVTRSALQPQSTRIVVVGDVASADQPGRTLIGVAKLRQLATGGFERDPGFGDGSGGLGAMRIGVPDTVCLLQTACTGEASAVGRPYRFPGGDDAPIYVAGSVKVAGEDWDFLLIKLTPTGAFDPNFQFGGLGTQSFDMPGSLRTDRVTALVVDAVSPGRDYDTGALWTIGNVSRACAGGVGAQKLRGDGATDPTWGNLSGGRGVFGGSDAPLCADDSPDIALGAIVDEGRLLIAGQSLFRDVGGNLHGDGLLFAINAGGGALVSRNVLPFQLETARFGESALYGVTPVGGGRYLVSGVAVYPPAGNVFAVARVVGNTGVFANGFE